MTGGKDRQMPTIQGDDEPVKLQRGVSNTSGGTTKNKLNDSSPTVEVMSNSHINLVLNPTSHSGNCSGL